MYFFPPPKLLMVSRQWLVQPWQVAALAVWTKLLSPSAVMMELSFRSMAYSAAP